MERKPMYTMSFSDNLEEKKNFELRSCVRVITHKIEYNEHIAYIVPEYTFLTQTRSMHNYNLGIRKKRMFSS